jgi:hypothetical protein
LKMAITIIALLIYHRTQTGLCTGREFSKSAVMIVQLDYESVLIVGLYHKKLYAKVYGA